jgi:hypothetical protein
MPSILYPYGVPITLAKKGGGRDSNKGKGNGGIGPGGPGGGKGMGNGGGVGGGGNPSGGGNGITNPGDIDGLYWNVDAEDISNWYTDTAETTAVASNGDTVASINLSGQTVGVQLQQATSTQRPTYSTNVIGTKPGLHFPYSGGTHKGIGINSTNVQPFKGCTIFWVQTFGTNADTSPARMFCWDASGKGIGYDGSPKVLQLFYPGSTRTVSGFTWALEETLIGAYRYNGTTWEVWKNGTRYSGSYSTGGDNYLDWLFLGSNTTAYNDPGYIHQMICYDALLTDTDMSSMFTYLDTKWETGLF